MALECEACEDRKGILRQVCHRCFVDAQKLPVAIDALNRAVAKIENIQTLCDHGRAVSMNENHEWTLASFVEELAEILGP